MTSKRDLLHLIHSDRESHLSFLQKLIQIPTPNPPGDTRDAVRFVEDYLSTHEISTEIIAPKEDAPNLVSTLQGTASANSTATSRILVLNGHIDVFPVSKDENWTRDPFSGDIADGYIHGRGGVDMKCGTAASILAFTYLHRFRHQLSGQCTLEVVSDEETGGRYGTKYLLDHADDEQRRRFRGDCVLNAEPSGLDNLRFGEKGTLRMTFVVRAQGAHGAYLHLSEGAIRIASRLIQRLVTLEELRGEGMDADLREYLSRSDVRQVADEAMGKGAADSMLKPTVNIGTIKGGAKVNMIPSFCGFEADMRLPIGLDRALVLAKIDEILRDFPGAEYSVQEAASNPSAWSPWDHQLVSLLQTNADLVRGKGSKTPLPISSMGATDCKHFRYRGVPAYAYGPSPASMAAVDERVSVEEFFELVKVHTLVAWEYLGGPG